MEKAGFTFLAGEQLAGEYRQAAKRMSEGEQPFTARVDISRDGVNDNKVVVEISFLGDIPQTSDGDAGIRALCSPLDIALHAVQSPVA